LEDQGLGELFLETFVCQTLLSVTKAAIASKHEDSRPFETCSRRQDRGGR
jgi:hypothetical protein